MSYLCNILVAILLLVQHTSTFSDECPEPYRSYDEEHSFCRLPNPDCDILYTGVTEDEKKLIVDVHNRLRNKVASGNEDRAGGMPPASDMTEMVWDDELAAVAQGWVYNCTFEHEIASARNVERFYVGQNLYLTTTTSKSKIMDFEKAITDWYDEVNDFNNSWVSAYQQVPVLIGHFTQVIWSNTTLVGCGYTVFRNDDGWTEKLFACDYGPGGNYFGKNVYKEGEPCTACPQNTSCDSISKYPTLCRAHSEMNFEELEAVEA